jgi:hypothetical protein
MGAKSLAAAAGEPQTKGKAKWVGALQYVMSAPLG